MVDYVKSAQNVKVKFDANGRTVTFRKKSETLADANEPWGDVTGAPEIFDTKALFDEYKNSEVDGKKVKEGDKRFFINAVDYSGDVNDFQFVIDGGVTWRIKKIKTIQPGDVAIMHEVQIRK